MAISTHLQIAARLLRDGQPALAVPFLRAAALESPLDASLQHDLGLACLEAGQLPEAITAFNAALALRPRYPDAQLRLGLALDLAGRTEEALAALRAAGRTDAQYSAAAILEALGRNEEALAAFRRVATAAPRSTLGRLAAAAAALLAQDDAEAEKKLRQALLHEPRNPAALERLAGLHAEHGRFAEAEPLYAAALEATPPNPGCAYELVRCRRMTQADAPLLHRLQRLVSQPGLDPAARARLHLAIGKMEEDLGDREAAARHFHAGQTLRDSLCAYDETAFRAQAARLLALPRSRFAGLPQTPPGGPILILGLPRTGTTLLEHMLSAHPAISAGGERPFWCLHGPALLRPATASQDPAGPDRRSQPPNEEQSLSCLQSWPDEAALHAAGAAYQEDLHRVAGAQHRDTRKAPLSASAHAAGRPFPPRITDKMPLNFLYAGLILLACPDALIIHCRRNLLDTAVSIQSTWFNPRMPFPTSPDALANYIRISADIMAFWRTVLPPGRFIKISYEKLTETPASVLRSVLAAADLPWHEPCLHPDSIAGILRTPSKFQARQKISRQSVGRGGRFRHCAEFAPLMALDAPGL